jgi:hypothetical protein
VGAQNRPEPAESVDERGDRLVQGTVGVILQAAFVFREPWLVPIVAVALGAGALLGPGANPLHRAYRAWLRPRLGADDATISPATVQAQDASAAVALLIASLAFPIGLGGFGWLLVIAVAIVAIVAATTRVHVGERLAGRFFRRPTR